MQEQEKAVTFKEATKGDLSGPPCKNCGTIMVTTGHCHTCPECGETSGCG